SMFSGVSGLRNHQIKMDVIGNNIANVNTQGFKASRTTFKEMYNQTLSAPSRPSEALGGTNAMQIGLGVSTGSIDMVFGTGSTQTTDRMLDLAIEGDGFLAVNQGEITYYTRSGNLYRDANGLLITSGGMYLQGVMFDLTAQIPDGADYDIEETTTFPEDNIFGGDVPFTYVELDDYLADALGEEDPGARAEWFATEGNVGMIFIPDSFSNISIGKNGMISGINAYGDLMVIGAIPLITFVNPEGLDRVGDNLYLPSSNSGIPVWHGAGEGTGAGTIKAGALEMSNVDLSREFTEMIITQRGFQANSRIITVSDTLLEELINLKR
ncbi:MAG: flagellar hook-basal body complex protein, partial [Oscillospiraceae bacterium]|nr:flagellar hook-basal body complex protein [Oscillospiraceae bacterium]